MAGYNTYVGARYVPVFANPIDWDNSKPYESLTIVYYNGNSYTSKIAVPAGVAITDEKYWALTGNYNAQVEQYRQETRVLASRVTELGEDVALLENYVTPQMFGAVGDGETDDTFALQKCFNDAYDAGKNIYIPSGTYVHYGLTIPCAGYSDTEFIMTILGSGKASAILKHVGNGVGVEMKPRNSAGHYINGAIVSGLSLNGNANTTIGLKINSGTSIDINNIRINNANEECLLADSVWICSFNRIYLHPASTNGSGLIMTGNCTTIRIDGCFVQGSRNIAYQINGDYSEIGSLAADNCTGECVYKLSYFKGNVGALGSEKSTVNRVLVCENTRANIGYLTGYKMNVNSNTALIGAANTSLEIDNIVVTTNTETTEFDNYFLVLNNSAIKVNGITGDMKFTKGINDSGSAKNSFVMSDKQVTGVGIVPYKNRSYLGTYRVGTNNNPQFDKNSELGVALFTDCSGSPRFKSDGTDCRYGGGGLVGDWYIENKPNEKFVAGYVITQNTGSDWNDGKWNPIPMILKGTTEERPTVNVTGLCYFDTTIGKPIWKNGNRWVDATGTDA